MPQFAEEADDFSAHLFLGKPCSLILPMSEISTLNLDLDFPSELKEKRLGKCLLDHSLLFNKAF